MTSEHSDMPRLRRLVRAAQGGDADAFEALVRPCADSLYRMAASCLEGREADVADAIQETVVAAWRHLGSLKQPSYFKTWLLRICINCCRQITRKRRPAASLDEVPERLLEDCGNRGAATAFEDADAFRNLVIAAGTANAPAIALFYGEGYSVRDIARLLGISEAAARQRLSRGRKRIAEILAGNEPRGAAEAPSAPRRPLPGGARPRAPSHDGSAPVRSTPPSP